MKKNIHKLPILLLGSIWFSLHAVSAPASFDFVFTVDSTVVGGANPSPSFLIRTAEGETYNYKVECDDEHPGTNETNAYGLTGDHYCVYDTEDSYTIRINGDFPRILFYDGSGPPYAQRLLTIEQWGTINWTSMENAFRGASNLEIHASDNPELTDTTSMKGMFQDATSVNQDISSWDVSHVNDFSFIFSGATAFNQDISTWDISGVTDPENLSNIFTGTHLSISNYDNLLLTWYSSDPLNNVEFNAGNSNYCRGTDAKIDMQQRDNWTFIDGVEDCAFHITSAYTMSVEDGNTAVDTVTLSFSDSETFFLLGNGEDGNKFLIDSKSGELRFITPVDMGNPTDKNGDNIYSVQVAAIDDTNDRIDVQTIRVTVEPVSNDVMVPVISYLLF